MPFAARGGTPPQHGGMHAPDLARRIENLIQLGTIAGVDLETARVTVQAGDLLTAPLPWLTVRAGDAKSWWAPSVGEQVLLLSPGGDPARGVVLPAVYSDANPAPAAAEKLKHTVHADGAVVAYDAVAHKLTATLPAGATAELTAPGGVTITGDTTINGKLHTTQDATFDANVDCAQTVTADTDCVGGGISLKTHVHTGVTSGGEETGPPQ